MGGLLFGLFLVRDEHEAFEGLVEAKRQPTHFEIDSRPTGKARGQGEQNPFPGRAPGQARETPPLRRG